MARTCHHELWFGFAFLAACAAAPADVCGDEGFGGAGAKANLDLPYSAESAEEEDESNLAALTLYGQRYEGDAVVLCVDRSMSLGGSDWQILQRELLRNLRDFDSRVEFALVFFDSAVLVIPSSRRLVPATAAAKQSAEATILALEPRNWTCLLAGLIEALNLAHRATTARRLIVLLSDGKALCPGHDPVTYRQEILTESLRRNFRRVPIHSLAVGDEVDFDFLCQISRRSGATCSWVGH